jgi:hypothetical protein
VRHYLSEDDQKFVDDLIKEYGETDEDIDDEDNLCSICMSSLYL